MELFLSQSTLNILVKGSVARKTSVSTSGKQQDVNGASNEVSAREKLLHDQHGLLRQFGLDLLPVLTQGEDLDMSSIEIGDDAFMIEDDDVSDDEDDYHEKVLRDDSLPVCIPENVHDVKLGDTADDPAAPSAARDNHTQLSSASYRTTTARGSESAEFRSGSPFGSRGAMAFAAAAVTGLASVSSRGISGGRDRRGVPYGSSDQYNKLIFTVGGKQLSKHLTIYQAVQCQLVLDADDDERFNGSDLLNDGSRFWSDIFKITCQKADGQMDRGSQGNSPSSVLKYSKSYSASNSAAEIRGQLVSFLDIILQGELLCDLEKSNPTYNILALLRVMEELNKLAPRLRVQAVADDFAEGKVSSLDEFYQTGAKVPPEEFINSKLTPKLARQIQDALALCSGSLPSWHVFRNYILDSAAKVMEMYSAVLEVEYFGTGHAQTCCEHNF